MLGEAIKSQARVILALMLREARTRFGRQKIGYLWALVEPILHISAFTLGFTLVGRVNPFGGSVAVFLATGLATYLGFRNVLNRTQGGYGSNEALLSFSVVKIMDVFIGRALLELATWILVTLLILGTLILFGYGTLPRSILMMLTAMLALFSIGFGVGASLGILSTFVPAVRHFMLIPNRVLYFTSGVFFLPDGFPPAIRDVIAWNPILHGITLFREGYYHLYDSQMLSIPYLVTWSVGSMFAALTIERVSRKAIRNLP